MAKDKLGLTTPEEARDERVDERSASERLMTDEQRLAAFRESFAQGKLPNLPTRDGWHRCWVSMMHQEDTPFQRQRIGYRFVRPEEVPEFDINLYPAAGNTVRMTDRIQVQEMVAMEIPNHLYAEYMRINHVERPDLEADKIRAKIEQATAMVHEARLGSVVESDALVQMRQRNAAPDFVAEEARRTA